MHKNLRLSQRAGKKKRRMEAMAIANGQNNSTSTNGDKGSKDDLLNPADQNISMEEYFQLYEKSADSYRSTYSALFRAALCRRD